MFVPASASAEEKARITDMRRNHPLFQSITLMLLTEIINSRLFTTVRDTLGLTYDVSWEVRYKTFKVRRQIMLCLPASISLFSFR